MRYDLPEIARRADVVALVGRYVALKRQGKDYVGLCPFHAERTPSFNVIPSKGKYHCYGCGAHGDVIDFVRKHLGYDLRRAVEFLGGGLATSPAAAPPAARPKSPSEREDAAHRISYARRIWKEACAIPLTPAEHYLRGRGIDVEKLPGGELPPTLRYHRRLRHSGTKKDYWALVGYMKNEGGFCGVHRTYLADADAEDHPNVRAVLDAQGVGLLGRVVVKAPVEAAKRMLGVAKGAAVRLAPAGAELAVAEGIETSLSVMVSTGLPAWAALSLGNLGGLVLPPQVHRVVLCADNDMKDPERAEAQLRQAAQAYRDQGVEVRIARPPEGMDFNDLLLAPFRQSAHSGVEGICT